MVCKSLKRVMLRFIQKITFVPTYYTIKLMIKKILFQFYFSTAIGSCGGSRHRFVCRCIGYEDCFGREASGRTSHILPCTLIIFGFVSLSIARLNSNASKVLLFTFALAYVSSIGAAFFGMAVGFEFLLPQLSITSQLQNLRELPELPFTLKIPL